MRRVRAFVYMVWIFVWGALVGVAGAPGAVFSRAVATWVVRTWGAGAIAGLRVICGLTVEVRGREHILPGPCLLAAKHQSMLDTIIPFLVMRDPSLVLKQELLKVPIYGWYAYRSGMIVVHREAQAAALKAMVRAARQVTGEGRELLIFPEGTRQAPGAAPDYKPGVAALYKDLNLPCTPVALNTGRFWPASGFDIRPGVAVMEFLPPLAPGLSRNDFMRELETIVETHTDRLLRETA